MTDKTKLDAVLNQYSSLRSEILTWTRTELTAISILFSIDSILFGYAITPQKHALFLVIPPITFLGTWLWLADHCMIRLLSAYIAEEIEKKRISELIGYTKDRSLWVEWETFVQEKMPKQLLERGADRTTIIIILLWFNTVLPIAFAWFYMTAGFNQNKELYGLCAFYLVLLIGITIYILRLSRRKYSELIKKRNISIRSKKLNKKK